MIDRRNTIVPGGVRVSCAAVCQAEWQAPRLRVRGFARNRRFVSVVLLTVVASGSSLIQTAIAQEAASAARLGDNALVRSLIAADADINVPEADGSTALLWAAYHSDTALTQALIDAGADVDTANRFGVTPLLQAARSGATEVVRSLLEGGASLEAAVSSGGETPLMAAARAGSVGTVSLLLEHGSDPNATESIQNQTALMWAAAEGHADVVDALIQGGADPDLQAGINDLTTRSRYVDFPTGGFTAAMWAARNGHLGVLQSLAAAGVDWSLTNGDGATALLIAIVNDRFDLAATLVRDLGAGVDNGALYHAVLMRDATTDWFARDDSLLRADHPNELTALDLIRVLLEAGGDPNGVFVGQMHSSSICCDTAERGTPFYRAAVAADVAALELLIGYGADVEWTPDNIESSQSAAGGPGRGRMNAGGSPLNAAMNGGNGVGMAGGPIDLREGEAPPFREQANREPADAVRALLEGGADPDRRLGNGSTILHDAARSNNIEIIRVLADHGAALDALNGDGLTALDIAEGRRAAGGRGGGMRGRGGFGGSPFGPPGGPRGSGPGGGQPTAGDVAALLRELMEAQGVPIVEHGIGPEAGPEPLAQPRRF
jgi:ankyrin repeat protein